MGPVMEPMNGRLVGRLVGRVHRLIVVLALGGGLAGACGGAYAGASAGASADTTVGGSTTAAATPGVDAPPAPGPIRPLAVPRVHQERLPNGLTLIVVSRPSLPLVTARVLVRGGSLADPAAQAGLADLTAALLTKGARRHGRVVDASTLARQAEALGSTLDAGAGPRALGLGMTVTPPRLDAALALMADVLREPLLAEGELQRSRSQMLDGLRVALADPAALAGMVARRAYWGATANGAITLPQTLQRITRADVQAFHRRWVRPDRAALLLVGDIDLPAARRLALRGFGRWAAPAAAPPQWPQQAPAPADADDIRVHLPGSGQSAVLLLGDFSAIGSPDRRVGQLANAVLGGAYSARLNQEVRIRRGLAYGASSMGESAEAGGMLAAATQTDHPSAAQVAELMRDEVARLAVQPPAAQELAARKAYLIGGFARRLETTAGLAGQLAELWAQQRPLETLVRLPEEIEAVTAAEVADYATRRWPRQRLRVVTVGDLEAAGPVAAAALGASASVEPRVSPQTLPQGHPMRRIDASKLDLEQASLVSPR